MDPETHKEIVEIRKDIGELRQAQDSSFHIDRHKYQKMVDDGIDNDNRAALVLLAIDGSKSVKEIQDTLQIPQKSCWRKFDRLEAEGVIYRTGEQKKGSLVYKQQRWFSRLRLADYVTEKYLKKEPQNAIESYANQEQIIQPDKQISGES